VKITLSDYGNREKLALDEIVTEFQRLINKASSLYESSKQYGRLEDLEEAIEILELVMSIIGDYISPLILPSLGVFLFDRFNHTGSMDDLNRAISITRNVLDATPYDDPGQARVLSNL
jgi:tetratricopeptide (TPR) repeat protein